MCQSTTQSWQSAFVKVFNKLCIGNYCYEIHLDGCFYIISSPFWSDSFSVICMAIAWYVVRWLEHSWQPVLRVLPDSPNRPHWARLCAQLHGHCHWWFAQDLWGHGDCVCLWRHSVHRILPCLRTVCQPLKFGQPLSFWQNWLVSCIYMAFQVEDWREGGFKHSHGHPQSNDVPQVHLSMQFLRYT